jgi:hypothetical protein
MSNALTIPAYPEDTTGTAVSNKVTGEQQVVLPADFSDFHFIVPRAAPFFPGGTLKLRTTGGEVRTLTLGIDYIPTHRFIDASLAQAKDIFGSYTLLNTQLAGIITLDYQTVGGQWTLDDIAWAKVVADKVHNPRSTSWDEVVNLPASFPPIDHDHPTA